MPTTTMQFERGAHDCHLYRNPAERRDVALPFIREGLENGEHCIFVTSTDSFDEWRREMNAVGIDADAEERRHRLQLMSGEAWRKPLATAGSLPMARDTLAMLKPLLQEFNGVRIIGDAEWNQTPPVLPSALCHWEATANVVFEQSDVRCICQYSVSDYAADMLHAALRTHASVIWNGERSLNAHDETALILRHEPELNEPKSDRRLVEEILRGLSQPDSSPTSKGRPSE